MTHRQTEMFGSVVDGSHDAVVQRANGWLQIHAPSTSNPSLVGTVVPLPALFLGVTPQAAAITAKAERVDTDVMAWRRLNLGPPSLVGAPSTRRWMSWGSERQGTGSAAFDADCTRGGGDAVGGKDRTAFVEEHRPQPVLAHLVGTLRR